MPTALSAAAILLTAVILPPCILILIRVLFPTILNHPWKLPAKESRKQKRDKETTVVFAGSFNPPHWGHLVMIKYLAERQVLTCLVS
jgi:ATP sulfurylase